MKIDPDDYRVREGDKVDLADWPTLAKHVQPSKGEYESLLREHVAKLSDKQQLLYATDRKALLLIFQGMDGAGKDGAISHVMSGVDPQGCEVASFKQPSTEELSHDFLWRAYKRLPARGRIGIFNRSYYEELLIVRVHPELLLEERSVAGAGDRKGFWKDRYRSITEMEAHLHRNGTRIVKFFLHMSRDEQYRRFLARMDDPAKNWKVSMGDVTERRFWDDYMNAYADAISATSTDHAPWYIVPADNKEGARLIVSQTILATLDDIDLKFRKADALRAEDLEAIRKALEKDG